jgi:biotin-(acetyl-CoA carboxylase) ligase
VSDRPPEAGSEAPAGAAGAAGATGAAGPAQAAAKKPAYVPQLVQPETVERYGRLMRHFAVAVSSEAMALAWANQEAAPHGAAVVVDHEINPRGFHGRLWDSPPQDTLACSVVLRPAVSVEEADATWLVAALGAVEAVEATTGGSFGTWWPDQVVEMETKDAVGAIRSEVQLGPGQVKAAVVTVRLDLLRLDLEPETDKERLLEQLVVSIDRVSEQLGAGAAETAAAYAERCPMLGQRVKIRLRPKGETRGIVRRIDRTGRLELESMGGMLERVGVDQLLELDVL